MRVGRGERGDEGLTRVLAGITKRPARTDRIFRKFDEDDIGYLNLVEFRGALEQVLGSAVSPRFARLIYRSYADHRGIDLEHFRVVILYWDRIKTAISDGAGGDRSGIGINKTGIHTPPPYAQTLRCH